jgi:glycosyltransferase involved in cell wall biosynthesis
MKLLHVIGSMNPDTGGPCQMIRSFAPWFLAQGHSLDVVCLNDRDAAFLKSEPFPAHAVGQGRGGWNYSPGLTPWFKKHLREYDAVILNGLWQFQGYALWRASKTVTYAPPFYIFPHGMLDPWFQKVSVRPLKAARNTVFWKTIQHRIIRDAAGLLFTCEEERRLAQLPFSPYQPRREEVVGLGVPEPPAFDERMKTAFLEKCPGVRGENYFLFLGRIHPKKGVDLLIQGYATLHKKNSGGKPVPKLVIAGPDLDSTYGREMQTLAAQLCPRDTVLWPGMISGDAKWGALFGCDAFVLVSHQENFGIAVVEALACGKPVLISDKINIWREIKDDQAGLISDDTDAGANIIFRQWKSLSPESRTAMQKSARACFENRFGIAPATRRLLAVIDPRAASSKMIDSPTTSMVLP